MASITTKKAAIRNAGHTFHLRISTTSTADILKSCALEVALLDEAFHISPAEKSLLKSSWHQEGQRETMTTKKAYRFADTFNNHRPKAYDNRFCASITEYKMYNAR